MASTRLRLVAVVLLLACVVLPARGLNITAMLNGYPDYKQFNKYLSETKVCDEINAREAITLLVLGDGPMSTLILDADQSLAGIKNALRLHAILDYFDPKKIRGLPDADTLTDTLYQAGGDAAGKMGNVKITTTDSGKIAFASANPGGKYDATLVKTIKQMPYKLAIMEISAPIEFDGLFDTPSATNLTRLLEKAGCKRFAALITSTGVLKTYESAMDKGLTLFAPNDDAFDAKGAPDVKKMPSADLIALLKYHALPSYIPKPSLKTVSRAMRTLASTASGNYNITVDTQGDAVTLKTGVDKSRVAATVIDNTPVCVLTVDNLLMPVELFGDAPAAAPSPDDAAPAPSPSVADASPPAPPPADAPSKPADHKQMKASSAFALRSVVGAFAGAVCSIVLL
ncbi:fasciclin-like arabinogalactan protein 10 [Oryza brachyantha]|uniref:fasciclin-like arabinogalactan protein 10 n=1 Tax=Oryza brachyantha TaxID=4533 RepID=UPI001ADC070C|nr:fasciclin-like arabinogalactan protein 10 [Oryza brachyantha]